jgi:hypothetical protein
MKSNQSSLAIVLVFAVAAASQAKAQIGGVAWSSVAAGCVVQSAGESLASIDAAHGTVSFKTGTAGDIKLSCPVASLTIRPEVPLNLVNDLHITFYMAHQPTHDARIGTAPLVGGVHRCFILVDLLRTNLNNVEAGASLATISASGPIPPGRQTLDQILTEALDFNTSYYWVDIQLHRDPAITAAGCNPEIVGTYLDYRPE